MMTARYFVDASGIYLGAYEGAEPPDAALEVPEPPEHAAQIWGGDDWLPLVRSKEEQEEARRAAYILEADPLFFMAQRGEGTLDDWTAKVAEIKARFPYPAE